MKRIDSLRDRLSGFRMKREQVKELDAEVKHDQPELIAAMGEVDPKNKGIVFDPEDSRGAAFIQQNDGSTVWDEQEIVDWLKKPARKSLWNKSSSRVFDVNKWEAMVASGEIPSKVAAKMKKQLDPPKPFIRFGKPKEDSL